MEIRLATPTDKAAAAEVHIVARNTYYEGHVDVAALDRRAAQLRAFYTEKLDRFDRRLWCAEIDGDVVGMALTGPSMDNLGPWVGQLYQIHVRPDHWREGIGTALHRTCLDAWREAGVTVGVLEVWSNNERAQSFYESHGWRPDGHSRPGKGETTYRRLRRTIV
ncbi:GNAT family N-acetyltransferase [Actinophytocola oryzae]|uniref:GNAT family N-acetyltransferase n=1 Tax=Actinophytocola oryzae TaxID=502181 RepID=UPI00141510C6|nr:GNAT family N-acetyltransferase [Actinophytocola oryzae]